MFFHAIYAIGGFMIVWFGFAMDFPYLAHPLTTGCPSGRAIVWGDHRAHVFSITAFSLLSSSIAMSLSSPR
jgi:hypothetical protein